MTGGLLGNKKGEDGIEGNGFDSSKMFVWIKGVESKVNNLRRELEIIKSDMTNKNDKLTKEIKSINNDLIELKRDKEKIKERLDLIIKELRLTAGKEEMMILKKYIDLWNPINFVTERDVERIIEEKLNKGKQ